MDKPVFEDNRCEILTTRYKERAAHLRDLNQYDLRLFGGFLTIQLALASWFAIHAPDSWLAKSAILVIDLALLIVCQQIISANRRRRNEIRTTILNINEAFGLYATGIYLPDKAINPPPPQDSRFIWYDVGCWVGVAGVAVALFAGIPGRDAGGGGQAGAEPMDTMIAAAMSAVSLLVSFGSFLLSFHIWKRSHRPIVTAAVKTHSSDSGHTSYDLVILNSGTIPAKNIQILADKNSLESAFGLDASAKNKETELAAFNLVIPILQNDDRVSGSFGMTRPNDTGFWKYNAIIPIVIKYEGWFGNWFGPYKEKSEIQIVDSTSFTGSFWGELTFPR